MPTRSCFDADGQPPVYEIEWPEPAEVAALCCNDYKPRIGETSYRCIIRDGWNVLLQPIGDYQPTRGDRDCYSLCSVVPPASSLPPRPCTMQARKRWPSAARGSCYNTHTTRATQLHHARDPRRIAGTPPRRAGPSANCKRVSTHGA